MAKKRIWKRVWRHLFPARNPNPNIGMVGDGDEIDLIMDLEAEFEVSFDIAFLENDMQKVGDLFENISAMRPDLPRDFVWSRFCGILQGYGSTAIGDIRADMFFFHFIYE